MGETLAAQPVGEVWLEQHAADFLLWEEQLRSSQQTTAAERPLQEKQTKHEQARSFDLSTSARMMRADLRQYGYVLPETRERVLDEDMSYVVEGVGRAACTAFSFEAAEDDLIYRKNGQRHSYVSMLRDGVAVARAEAAKDKKRQFLADEAVRDLEEHAPRILSLQPGEQYVWDSAYRHDLESTFGVDFMRSCGRFPERKMGFVYRASRDYNGLVTLESQTLDRSDPVAYEALRHAAAANPNISMGALVAAYDSALELQHGRPFYAGRTDAEKNDNAWHQILAQRDLVEHYLQRTEQLAASSLEGNELTAAAEKLTYQFWAAFKQRLHSNERPQASMSTVGRSETPRHAAQYKLLEQELQAAFQTYVARGEVMVGCGGAISFENPSGDERTPENTYDTIFGKGTAQSNEDCEFISKECPNCHAKNVKTKVTSKEISGSCGCRVKRSPK